MLTLPAAVRRRGTSTGGTAARVDTARQALSASRPYRDQRFSAVRRHLNQYVAGNTGSSRRKCAIW